MENKTHLGLEEYTTIPKTMEYLRLEEIKHKFVELYSRNLAVERLPRELLAHEIASHTYPQISPDFLTASNDVSFKRKGVEPYRSHFEIQLPKFGIYRLSESTMELEIGVHFGCGLHSRLSINSPKNIHPIIQNPLVRSLDLFREDFQWMPDYNGYEFNKRVFSKKGRKKLNKIGYPGILIRSTLNGIIPSEVLERLDYANRLFGKDQVYLAKEVKPEEWNAQIPTRDPLVLGVNRNKCFLIGKFDTTPLENYVTHEFGVS